MTTYINYMHDVTTHPHPTPKFIIKKIVYLNYFSSLKLTTCLTLVQRNNKLIFEKIKNKYLYSLTFRANSNFGVILAKGQFPIPILRSIPILIPILDFFSKFKTDDLCN
jgi:hypothetical protein